MGTQYSKNISEAVAAMFGINLATQYRGWETEHKEDCWSGLHSYREEYIAEFYFAWGGGGILLRNWVLRGTSNAPKPT